jgi:uncharacterized membrane protein
MSFLFDALGLLFKKQELERAAWWTLLVGSIGLAATVVSGLLAEKTVLIPDSAQEHFETHEQIAFIVASIYSVLLLWRIAGRTSLPKQKEWLFVGLSLVGVILIWTGAWYGGELVYRFAVGVQR